MALDGKGSGQDDLCPLCGDTVWSHLYENDVPRECACCGCRAYLDDRGEDDDEPKASGAH